MLCNLETNANVFASERIRLTMSSRPTFSSLVGVKILGGFNSRSRLVVFFLGIKGIHQFQDFILIAQSKILPKIDIFILLLNSSQLAGIELRKIESGRVAGRSEVALAVALARES